MSKRKFYWKDEELKPFHYRCKCIRCQLGRLRKNRIGDYSCKEKIREFQDKYHEQSNS